MLSSYFMSDFKTTFLGTSFRRHSTITDMSFFIVLLLYMIYISEYYIAQDVSLHEATQ